eukprot:gene10148-2568_t
MKIENLAKEKNPKNFTVLCKHCKEEQEAHFCGECSDTFCSTCFQILHTPKAKQNHEKLELSEKNTKELFCLTCSVRINTPEEVLDHKNHDYKLTSDYIIDIKGKLQNISQNVQKAHERNGNEIVKILGKIEELQTKAKELEEINKTLQEVNLNELDSIKDIDILLKWENMFKSQQLLITDHWNFVKGEMKIKHGFITKKSTSGVSQNRFCVLDQKIEDFDFKFKVNISNFIAWIGIGVVTEKLAHPKRDKPWQYTQSSSGFYGISANGYGWNDQKNGIPGVNMGFVTGDSIEVSVSPSKKKIEFRHSNGSEYSMEIKQLPCYPAIQLNTALEQVEVQFLY